MKPQKPAMGISMTDEYLDSKLYHVECTCTDPDHAVEAWIEVGTDKDLPDDIHTTFYVTTSFDGWRSARDRIREAWHVLRTGKSTRQHSLLLHKQSALNFSDAIVSAIADLEEPDDSDS